MTQTVNGNLSSPPPRENRGCSYNNGCSLCSRYSICVEMQCTLTRGAPLHHAASPAHLHLQALYHTRSTPAIPSCVAFAQRQSCTEPLELLKRDRLIHLALVEPLANAAQGSTSTVYQGQSRLICIQARTRTRMNDGGNCTGLPRHWPDLPCTQSVQRPARCNCTRLKQTMVAARCGPDAPVQPSPGCKRRPSFIGGDAGGRRAWRRKDG